MTMWGDGWCDDAADRLEALQARVDALKASKQVLWDALARIENPSETEYQIGPRRIASQALDRARKETP